MRSLGPRLKWRKDEKTYVIRDGTKYIRTGCGVGERPAAQEKLDDYIASKYKPQPTASPILADVLRAYFSHKPSERHTIQNLSRFWADRLVSDVNAGSCRDFCDQRPPVAARRDLETLRAAIRHWHKFVHPLPIIPPIVLPPPPEPRERWLSRSEMAKLLRASRKMPHLARFLIIGYYSGSRSGNILGLQWGMIDFERGLIKRRKPGQAESRTKRAPIFKAHPRLLFHLRRWRRIDEDLKLSHVIHYDMRAVASVKKSWKSMCRSAEVKEATPHALRHTRVSEYVSGGISIWDTAKRVGMSPLMVERVYGHLQPGWQED